MYKTWSKSETHNKSVGCSYTVDVDVYLIPVGTQDLIVEVVYQCIYLSSVLKDILNIYDIFLIFFDLVTSWFYSTMETNIVLSIPQHPCEVLIVVGHTVVHPVLLSVSHNESGGQCGHVCVVFTTLHSIQQHFYSREWVYLVHQVLRIHRGSIQNIF